jgi:hypothetical protein
LRDSVQRFLLASIAHEGLVVPETGRHCPPRCTAACAPFASASRLAMSTAVASLPSPLPVHAPHFAMLERDTNLQAAPEADAARSDEQAPDAAALKGKRKAVVGAPRGAAEAEGPASATPAKKAKLGELRSSTAQQRSRMLMRRLVTSGRVESEHASAQD